MGRRPRRPKRSLPRARKHIAVRSHARTSTVRPGARKIGEWSGSRRTRHGAAGADARRLRAALGTLADDLLVAIIATSRALAVTAVTAFTDKVLMALFAVALFQCALAVVADYLVLRALVTLARWVVALVALTDDQSVPVLVITGAVLKTASAVPTDDTLAVAVVALAGDLGCAVVAVADGALLIPRRIVAMMLFLGGLWAPGGCDLRHLGRGDVVAARPARNTARDD